MRRSRILLLAGTATMASCASPQPSVKIRQVAAAAESYGVGDAEAQLALGNVGLALEGFHKVLRDRPGDVRASIGLARSYDEMSRFDLSRRWYETALAKTPDDPSILTALAGSLEQQGKIAEAVAVRAEAERNTAASDITEEIDVATNAAPLSVAQNSPAGPAESVASPENRPRERLNPVLTSRPPVDAGRGPKIAPQANVALASQEYSAPVAAGSSVTVHLPPPSSLQTSREPAQGPRATTLAAEHESNQVRDPHLERLSLGEVALVTKSEPIWRAEIASRSTQSVTFRWVALGPVARLLNAARIEGLAARTRSHLVEHGWNRIAIGDAPATLSKTLVLYPALRRGTAQRLASQFGFTQLRKFDGDEILVLLGRDAAAMKILRPA